MSICGKVNGLKFGFPSAADLFDVQLSHSILNAKTQRRRGLFHTQRGLKARHLKGQSVRAVIRGLYRGMRSVGPTPIVIVYRCRTYSAPLIIYPHLTALTDCPVRCRAFSPRKSRAQASISL